MQQKLFVRREYATGEEFWFVVSSSVKNYKSLIIQTILEYIEVLTGKKQVNELKYVLECQIPPCFGILERDEKNTNRYLRKIPSKDELTIELERQQNEIKVMEHLSPKRVQEDVILKETTELNEQSYEKIEDEIVEEEEKNTSLIRMIEFYIKTVGKIGNYMEMAVKDANRNRCSWRNIKAIPNDTQILEIRRRIEHFFNSKNHTYDLPLDEEMKLIIEIEKIKIERKEKEIEEQIERVALSFLDEQEKLEIEHGMDEEMEKVAFQLLDI